MEIVIKIPNFEWLENEEDFKTAVKEYDQGTKFDKEIRNALINGKILPEHHGRLIDADALLDKKQDYGEGQMKLILIDPYYVRKAPTIIEGSDNEC